MIKSTLPPQRLRSIGLTRCVSFTMIKAHEKTVLLYVSDVLVFCREVFRNG